MSRERSVLLPENVKLRPQDRAIVERILNQCVPDDVVISVFGSRVRGRMRHGSDLDIAFEGPGPLDTDLRATVADAFEDSMLPFRVDIIDLSEVDEAFRAIVTAHAVRL